MERKITIVAAIMGMLAIILGAFGAHALKSYLSQGQLATFETGVRYQMYHAFFLLFVGMNKSITEKLKLMIYRLLIVGVLLFSGSIYFLSTKSIFGADFKWVGVLTPIGGTLLIASWGILLWNFLKRER